MIPILWDGPVPQFREAADRLIRQTLDALGLSREVRGVVLAPRDGRYGDDAWIRWTHGRPVRIWLEPEAGAFLSRSGREAARRRGLRLGELPARRFAPRPFREMLFHELTHVHDELRHGIRADRVPAAWRQKFNEAWNVWIDGRLSRWGRPGVRRSERRDFFHRILGGRQGAARTLDAVFERLWNADQLTHEDLLEVVRGGGMVGLAARSLKR